MGTHSYTVEFRILGLPPSSVTNELGLQPCQVRSAGAERVKGRIDANMWAYNGADNEVSWDSLEDGLDSVLTKLWALRGIIAGYEEKGAQLIWWCGHFSSSFDGGPSLSPSLLKRLGEFGAELFLDNYFSA